MAQLSSFHEIYADLPGATMPIAVQADGLVYAAGLTGVDMVTGTPADGLRAQVAQALDHMQTGVEGAGGSLDNVARAVAYVNAAEDRDPVYEPWDELFPDPADRPAFKVLVGKLPPGELVRLDGLSVLGARRTRVDIENVPARDPTVRLGNWVFTSRVHGIHPETGIPDDPDAEARQTFDNLATLLELNGCTSSDLVQMTLFCRDAAHFETADQAYAAVFPDASTRPPMHKLISFVTPRFNFGVEMIAVRNQGAPQTAFQEIFLEPSDRCIPEGARLGALVIAPGLTGSDPATGTVIDSGAEAQIGAALSNMERLLAAAGSGAENIARATFYMPDVDDRSTLNAVWSARFPDEETRPPHKYAPAALSAGQEVRLQLLALPGADRQTLVIPGLKHMDPMSMGALTGNLVTSSRIFGTHAFTGERAKDEIEGTALAFEHAGTLLAQAGTDWQHLVQLTAFIGDPAHRPLVEDAWQKHTAATSNSPRLNIVETRWAGVGAPRLEIVALT